MTVTLIKPTTSEPNPHIVDTLRELLHLAKQGKIQWLSAQWRQDGFEGPCNVEHVENNAELKDVLFTLEQQAFDIRLGYADGATSHPGAPPPEGSLDEDTDEDQKT